MSQQEWISLSVLRHSWINKLKPIRDAFVALHTAGLARSIEVWRGEIQGEFLCADSGLAALIHLTTRLHRAGFVLLDVQFVTPHLRRFGAVGITQTGYRALLTGALHCPARVLHGYDPSETDALLSAWWISPETLAPDSPERSERRVQ